MAPASTRSFTALVLAFTLGVLLVHALPRLPALHELLLATAVALVPWRGRALRLALVLGLAYTSGHAQRLLGERWDEARFGEEQWIAGTIASLPERHAGRDDEAGAALPTYRFLFAPHGRQWPSRLRVSWYEAPQKVRGGDCWRLQLRLRPPHGSLNPGGFDYEGWLFRQHVGATASVRSAQPCDGRAALSALPWRQRLADRIREALTGHPAPGLFVALTLGDESGIDDAQWDVFRRTGVSHLVAISGLNIAIVAGCAFFLFRWGWVLWPALAQRLPAQKAGMLGAAMVATAYALLAGFEPPVVRALLMLCCVLVAAWRGRLSRPTAVLASAWLAILVLDPCAVLSAGLWLSFGAVLAIFYLSIGRHGANTWVHALVLLQLMLSVLLAPLGLQLFQGLSWIAPLVNLLAVPWFSLLTPLLLGAVLLLVAVPSLGTPCVQALAGVLHGTDVALAWIATQAPAPWVAGAPGALPLAIGALGVVLLFAPRGLPLRMPALLCLVPLAFPAGAAPRAGFELTVLDVGQGLATVVRTRGHVLVFDTGPAFDDGFDAGASVLGPYLLASGVAQVDRLILSHGDNDHAGGAPALRRLLPVRDAEGYGARPCRDGERWEWDGVRFAILHPDGDAWAHNNASCVLRIETDRFSALIPGDIEAGAERRLLRAHPDELLADVLVAPHHGSATSSTEAFVAAVHPRFVVHSAGWHSAFRHPRAEVVARYTAIGAQQWVTGDVGAVTLRSEDDGVVAEGWRARHARFWNAAYSLVGLGASP